MTVPDPRSPAAAQPAASQARPAGPRLSNRKKLAFSLLMLLGLALATEAALRIADPEILRFALAARRTHDYRASSRTDLRPQSSGRFHLTRDDGSTLYDFTLAVDAIGQRSAVPNGLPQTLHASRPRVIVHCIGDSFTLGWGVAAEQSYPARLQEGLGPGYLVLNLGADGIGLLAARERMLRVAQDFPPAIVLWLFIENDVAEDAETLAHRERWALRHAWERFYAGARRRSYLLNVPFALRWTVGLKPRMNRPEAEDRAAFGTVLDRAAWLAAAQQAALPDHATARALLELYAECQAGGVDFRAVFIQSNLESYGLGRLCLEHRIPLIVEPMPYELRIRNDWHLNAEGNRRLAVALAEQVSGAKPE
jgi:hypothetical protein